MDREIEMVKGVEVQKKKGERLNEVAIKDDQSATSKLITKLSGHVISFIIELISNIPGN